MIYLKRVVSTDQGTFGVLVIDDKPVCVTCEDPWRGNQVGESCIPEGAYLVQKYSGSKFKDVWQVMNVPGRSAILLHVGNSIKDTHGCILLGRSFATLNGLPSITNSVDTLDFLRKTLPDSFTLVVQGT